MQLFVSCFEKETSLILTYLGHPYLVLNANGNFYVNYAHPSARGLTNSEGYMSTIPLCTGTDYKWRGGGSLPNSLSIPPPPPHKHRYVTGLILIICIFIVLESNVLIKFDQWPTYLTLYVRSCHLLRRYPNNVQGPC